MSSRIFSGIMLALLLIGMLTLAISIQPARAQETIRINSDGSITPTSAPIQRNGNVYTLTDDINITENYDCIIVQAGNVVLDGANHTLWGIDNPSALGSIGVQLLASNDTVTNCNMWGFWIGILPESDNNTISQNQITEVSCGIDLDSSSFNQIVSNNITSYDPNGITITGSSNSSLIVGNNISSINFAGAGPNNSIYHNHILSSIYPQQMGDAEQIWDDGYPSGGNLWQGYSGFDFYSGPYQNETGSDGIGDVPYVINANNIDHHPWMMMRTPIPVPPVAAIDVNISSSPVLVGDSVVFNASRSVCGWNGNQATPLTEYVWNFDDGNIISTTQRELTHTFKFVKLPFFKVELTVIDTENNNSSAFAFIEAMMPTSISISTTASATVGSGVNISGKLGDIYGKGLVGQPILISYTFSGANSWFPITSTFTDNFGNYNVQWIPTATGYFTINAEYTGNGTNLPTDSNVTLSTIPYKNQYVFSVESNSTVSNLMFDTSQDILSFSVNGESGTSGITTVTIGKSRIVDATKLNVLIDGNPYNYTLTETSDSWVLGFTYEHSSHTVQINMEAALVPEFSNVLILFLLVTLAAAVLVARKRKLKAPLVSL